MTPSNSQHIMRIPHSFNMTQSALVLWAMLFTILPLLAFAHGGEDHGDEAKAPISVSAASGPRLELTSPDVELSGLFQDGKLTLYADHYATNEPIANAKIELESGGRKIQISMVSNGIYTATADSFKQPGKHDVVVSIEAGDLEDLLIGSFEIPASTITVRGLIWLDYAKWTAVGIAVVILLVVLFKRIRRHKTIAVSVTIPLLAVFLFSGYSNPTFAHGDEDHSEKPKISAEPSAVAISMAPTAQSSPQRLPDGSIFAPKPTQRLFGIRTILGETRDNALTVELNGHIIANPNFSGRIQSSQSGRIAAPVGGFPAIGMKVIKGQILAYIEPAASSIDKGNQQAQLAELSSNLVIAENRAQRMAQLQGSVPQKEIDAARAEAVSLKARKAAVTGSFQREALRAPVSGLISFANVVAGQVVEAKEILFEVIDPSRLRVEAVAYDSALTGQIAGATGVTESTQPLMLAFIGQSYQLREQALPIQFDVTPPLPALSVGQPVTVFVQTRKTRKGIPIPQGSIMKNSSGEIIVWVHISAERFVPKKVKVQPIDVNTVSVIEGLHDGDRVVTQGAALLSQIR